MFDRVRRSTPHLPAAGIALFILGACGGSDTPEPTATPKTVSVGGSITGLRGSGLVLQNNGTGDLTVSPTDTSFQFAGIATQTAYNVTIKSQPASPTQGCTINNGSGSTATADIKSLAVSCVTSSFVVRGTIIGLSASGLTLQLNGGGTQAIATGATTFAFPALASGTAYAVTIGTQPTGQTCTVAGGTGTVGSADVTTVAVTCTTTAFGISGTVLTLASGGLTLRLNGGTPIAVASGASNFSFANLLQTGDDYVITMDGTPSAPLHSCLLNRARGRVAAASISDPVVRCFSNSPLAGLGGTYEVLQGSSRTYLTMWTDGTYSLALRNDESTCPNNGNGVEYGVYKRASDNSFFIHFAIDNTGGCGLWNGGGIPGQGGGASGSMTRTGNTLTSTITGVGTITLQAVASVSGSLVGSWMRADGRDGSYIVFANDGTYLYQQTQSLGGALTAPIGWERGCYAISGSTFTTSQGANCKPDGVAATDLNGISGFSNTNGAAISFTIAGPNSVTIGGVAYTRILPEG